MLRNGLSKKMCCRRLIVDRGNRSISYAIEDVYCPALQNVVMRLDVINKIYNSFYSDNNKQRVECQQGKKPETIIKVTP
jgi:exonuclease I